MKEMLMMIRDQNQIVSDQEPITTTTSWKLYENPHYYPKNKNHLNLHYQQHHQEHHHIHLPVSARQIASSLSDFTFFQSIMVSQLESQIKELKSELEFERKLRKKVESLNTKLSKEVTEQRKQRESLQCLCEELAEDIASDKAIVDQMKSNMEEERRMLRMSEVLREERVQMKLSEANILFQEKLLELDFFKFRENFNEEDKLVPNVKSNLNLKSNGIIVRSNHRKTSSSETENPHIKRGIKGFFEFPRVVKEISLRGKQLMVSKLDPQKTRLQLLLIQKSPFVQ